MYVVTQKKKKEKYTNEEQDRKRITTELQKDKKKG